MWSDNDDEDDEEDDEEGGEEDGEDMDMSGDEGDDEGAEDMGDEGDEDEVVDPKAKFKLGGKGGDVGGGMGDAGPMFSKKSSKKKMQKEATDEEKWWSSVHSMTGSSPDAKYNDGWTEYQSTGGGENLFTPVDTENLTQAVRPEPGQIGFAPSGRIGS